MNNLQHLMTNEEIIMPLVLLPTPEKPACEVCSARTRSRVSRYKFIRLVQQLGAFLLIGLLSIAAYFAVSEYLFKSVEVVGISMVPTLSPGGHYLLDRMAFRNRDPKHDEIVVIRDPGDHGLAVKRIIAVGGESVHFKNGSVYVNGKKLDESFLPAHTMTFTYGQTHEEFITCGKDQYFVLGDNREQSVDSRSYGPVSRQDILGLVKFK